MLPLRKTIFLLTLAFVTPLAAFATEAATLKEKNFSDQIQSFEARISASATLNDRLSVLGEIKKYIDKSLKETKGKKASETRSLRFSLHSLETYLELFEPKDFLLENCPAYRNSILLAMGPRGDDPDDLPGETARALKILSLVCKDPTLAKIPPVEKLPTE